MVKRILTSVLLLPVLLAIIYVRGVVLDISVALITMIALFELFRGFENVGVRPMLKLSLVTVLMYYTGLYFEFPAVYHLFVTSFFTLVLMLISLFGKAEHLNDVSITAFGFLYVVIPFVHIALVNRLDQLFLLIYVFILAWVSDTCAYFIGKFFGKKKLLPAISPNKTIAGSVAGVVGTAAVSVLFAYFFAPKDFLVYAAPLGALGSVAGQIGDLIASKIKRYVKIKDYGKLIPGHGGILDRFDSIMLTAPIVYYIGYVYLNFK